MALTPSEESRVRGLLAKEKEEDRYKILKNIASFLEWLSKIYKNLGGIEGITELFDKLCCIFQ